MTDPFQLPPQLLSLPSEDSGADTADRYDWQAQIAASDCFALVRRHLEIDHPGCDGSDLLIICEHHTDFIVVIQSMVEIVSVKHRDAHLASWTRSSLAGDGGLGTLFLRWKEIGFETWARLISNAALGDAALNTTLGALRNGSSLTPAQEIVLEDLRERISAAAAVPVSTDEIRAFGARLTLDMERPSRQHLPYMGAGAYALPLIVFLALAEERAGSAWTAASDVFRSRMRGGRAELGALSAELGDIITRASDIAALRSRIEARTVSGADLLDIVTLAVGRSRRETSTASPTRLRLKLLNGGCDETLISAAEMAAERWRNYEASVADGAIGSETELLAARTHAIIKAAVIRDDLARATSGDYGPEMWRKVQSDMSGLEFSPYLSGVDDDLAFGLVCNLASECKVWFSGEFDITVARMAYPERIQVTA